MLRSALDLQQSAKLAMEDSLENKSSSAWSIQLSLQGSKYVVRG